MRYIYDWKTQHLPYFLKRVWLEDTKCNNLDLYSWHFTWFELGGPGGPGCLWFTCEGSDMLRWRWSLSLFSVWILHLAQFHQSSHHHYSSRDGITCSLLETAGCRQTLGGAPTHCVVATFGRACAANFSILNAFWGLTLSIYFLLSRKRAKLERWWGDRASVEGKSGETDGSGGRPGTSCWWCTPCNIDLRFFTTFCPWIWKFIHEYESLARGKLAKTPGQQRWVWRVIRHLNRGVRLNNPPLPVWV